MVKRLEIRMPKEIDEMVRISAKRNHRSLNQQLVYLLEAGLRTTGEGVEIRRITFRNSMVLATIGPEERRELIEEVVERYHQKLIFLSDFEKLLAGDMTASVYTEGLLADMYTFSDELDAEVKEIPNGVYKSDGIRIFIVDGQRIHTETLARV